MSSDRWVFASNTLECVQVPSAFMPAPQKSNKVNQTSNGRTHSLEVSSVVTPASTLGSNKDFLWLLKKSEPIEVLCLAPNSVFHATRLHVFHLYLDPQQTASVWLPRAFLGMALVDSNCRLTTSEKVRGNTTSPFFSQTHGTSVHKVPYAEIPSLHSSQTSLSPPAAV